MNPFKPEYPEDPELEGHVHDLLAPLGAEEPAPDAALGARQLVVEATSHPAAPHGLGFRQRMLLGAAALITPLMAVTAVGALAGDGSPVGALAGAVGLHGGGASITADETPTTNDPTATDTATATATDTETATETATPSPEGDATTEAVGVHENGLGCDDKLWADNPDGPPFGGHDTPVGPCNEDDEEDEVTPTPEATPTATEAAEEEDEQDPHTNGHGCDDKLFADNPDGPPFGHHEKPVGPCKGDDGSDATPTATASATAGVNTAGSDSGPGNGKGNNGGNGKGKNK